MEVNTFAKVSCPRNSEWFGNGEKKTNLFLGKALDVSCITIFCQLKRLIRTSVHWRDLGRYTAYIILLYQLIHLITITSITTSLLLNHFKTSSWPVTRVIFRWDLNLCGARGWLLLFVITSRQVHLSESNKTHPDIDSSTASMAIIWKLLIQTFNQMTFPLSHHSVDAWVTTGTGLSVEFK